jgi:hypothetical protein
VPDDNSLCAESVFDVSAIVTPYLKQQAFIKLCQKYGRTQIQTRFSAINVSPQKEKWAGLDSNQRKLTLTGLQPVPFSLSGTDPFHTYVCSVD